MKLKCLVIFTFLSHALLSCAQEDLSDTGGKELSKIAILNEIAESREDVVYFDEKLFIDAQMQERVASPHLDEEIWKRAVQPDQYTSSEEPYVYATHEKADDYRDWKHMIAYEGTELAAFRNQCVGVTLNPIQVPAGKSVTTSVFCYFSNRTDREVY